jgi:hypothetical protein
MAVNSLFQTPRSGVILAKWSGFAASGDAGQPFDAVNYVGPLTVQVAGPTGGTSAVVIEGSNEPTNGYTTLTGPTGNTLSFTAAGLKIIAETPRYIRPRIDTATGSVATWEVDLVARTPLR